MCMCEQMILAVFMIAAALRAISEFQIRIIQFSPSTNGTPVPCSIGVHLYRTLSLAYILLKFSLSLQLLRRIRPHIPGSKEKEQEIKDRHHRSHRIGLIVNPKRGVPAVSRQKCLQDRICKIQPVKQRQILHLDRYRKNKRNCTFGYSAANAKNRDIFRYHTDNGSDIPVVTYTNRAAITWNSIPEKK